MKRTALALVSILAAPAAAQDPVTDYADAVAKAVEHDRFAVRRAAAGKVAQGGDAAVPALRAYEAAHGRNAFPLELVDAIASSPATGRGIEALLEAWATDVDFYWRSQALGGLARRGVERVVPLFRRAVDDPSHLYRIEGARGLLAVGDPDADRLRVDALRADPDPRARLRVALLLLEAGDPAGVGEIVAAVDGVDRRFVDDPWGAREALFALRELRRLTGRDFTAALGDEAEPRAAARDALDAWARDARPGWEPADRATRPAAAVGGVEIRSCRNGDLFVRWTEDGGFLVGLDPLRRARVARDAFTALRDGLAELGGVATHGRVVCDFVRIHVPVAADGPAVEVHHKAAPGAVPAPVHEWLKALAAALDESGEGARLRDRLEQFAATDRK